MAETKREFDYNEKDFQRIRELIYKHAGIALGENKTELVYSRLARRLRATGSRTFADYIRLLETGDKSEWQAFVNALTTNLTAFFREPHHFTALSDYLKTQSRRPINIWCAACSTGEEPYSIAMTALNALGMQAQLNILATDLDTNVLDKARHGVYTNDQVSKVPDTDARRYFSSHAPGEMRVRPEVQRFITFRQHNLLDTIWSVRGPMDIIFCRNVMIYFDRETQYRILRKFADLLHPDGLLFAGHSENFFHAQDIFRLKGRTVYEPVKPQTSTAHSARAVTP